MLEELELELLEPPPPRYSPGRQIGAKNFFFKAPCSQLPPIGDLKLPFFQFIYFLCSKNDFWTRGFQSFHQEFFSVVQLNQITKKMNKQPSVDGSHPGPWAQTHPPRLSQWSRIKRSQPRQLHSGKICKFYWRALSCRKLPQIHSEQASLRQRLITELSERHISSEIRQRSERKKAATVCSTSYLENIGF